ncbi:MAG: hypothetical protein HC834_06985 [Rhodospirillales bacterium]|nr:hypothetical protein [Rhodospirillales bacterium]
MARCASTSVEASTVGEETTRASTKGGRRSRSRIDPHVGRQQEHILSQRFLVRGKRLAFEIRADRRIRPLLRIDGDRFPHGEQIDRRRLGLRGVLGRIGVAVFGEDAADGGEDILHRWLARGGGLRRRFIAHRLFAPDRVEDIGRRTLAGIATSQSDAHRHGIQRCAAGRSKSPLLSPGADVPIQRLRTLS